MFEIENPLTEYDPAALAALLTQAREALNPLLALEAPTDEDVTEAERIAGLVASLVEEQERRAAEPEAAAARVARLAALREAQTPTPTAEETAAAEAAAQAEVEAAAQAAQVFAEDLTQSPAESDAEFAARQGRHTYRDEANRPAVTASGRVARIAAATVRPVVPEQAERHSLVASASADVPGYSTGSALDMAGVASALVNRTRGFSVPQGDGQSVDLRQFGVATLRKDFPEDLIVSDRGGDAQQVIDHAAAEHRLPGQSLVAAGGWCAPSETLYDFCQGETAEGLLDVPEVQVNRGGIRFTPGPDFSTIYDNTGFAQTEAQAIAGTTKPCYEVTCPAFTEIRLDAVGLCIKVPILTQAAYPELVQRVISGALIAHQHRVSARLITAMVTAAGVAVPGDDFGSLHASSLGALELRANVLRQRYRLSMNETMEVVLPFWVKAAIRQDLGLRTGQEPATVTDEQITAHFAARGLRVQWVYNYQPLATTGNAAAVYPATVEALIYPAGSFVKGTSDVINLNAVYDAASLAVNTYTGLFVEECVLLAQKCYTVNRITIPVCLAGRTGAANIVECGITATV